MSRVCRALAAQLRSDGTELRPSAEVFGMYTERAGTRPPPRARDEPNRMLSPGGAGAEGIDCVWVGTARLVQRAESGV